MRRCNILSRNDSTRAPRPNLERPAGQSHLIWCQYCNKSPRVKRAVETLAMVLFFTEVFSWRVLALLQFLQGLKI